MSDEKLTPWFSDDVKPLHVGVYETSFDTYQHWNGEWWGYCAVDVQTAYEMHDCKSALQRNEWRGLAKEPK
jgi:hypothetical protein